MSMNKRPMFELCINDKMTTIVNDRPNQRQSASRSRAVQLVVSCAAFCVRIVARSSCCRDRRVTRVQLKAGVG